MGGNRHDCAGSIISQNIIGNPDWDSFVVYWVQRILPQEHSGFLSVGSQTLDVVSLLDFLEVVIELLTNLWGCGTGKLLG